MLTIINVLTVNWDESIIEMIYTYVPTANQLFCIFSHSSMILGNHSQ